MAAITGIDGFVELFPWAGQFAACRMGDKRRVASPAARAPQHVQFTVLLEEEWAVRHVCLIVTALVPWGVRAAEQHERFAGGGRQIIRQRNGVNGTTEPFRASSKVQPFMAEDHVRLAVLHPQRAIETHPFRRCLREFGNRHERPFRRVSPHDLRAAFMLVRIHAAEEIEFSFVFMDFRRPEIFRRPEALRRDERGERAFPIFQILALQIGEAWMALPFGVLVA